MKIERFEDIEGWQLGRQLTSRIYAVTGKGRFASDRGLRDQITRAAGSIMHNVAEGFDAGSNAEFTKFLRYAQRSCTEVQSQLYVALDQKYVSQSEFEALYDSAKTCRSKIGGFIKYLLAYETERKRNLEPRTSKTKNQEQGTRNQEPRTKNQEPRTKNQEPRTKNA